MSSHTNPVSTIFGSTEPVHRDGIAWYEAKRPFLIHKCRAQTTGFLGLSEIQRCACGGIRHSTYRHWLKKNQRWIDTKRSMVVAPAIAGLIALVAVVAVFLIF